MSPSWCNTLIHLNIYANKNIILLFNSFSFKVLDKDREEKNTAAVLFNLGINFYASLEILMKIYLDKYTIICRGECMANKISSHSQFVIIKHFIFTFDIMSWSSPEDIIRQTFTADVVRIINMSNNCNHQQIVKIVLPEKAKQFAFLFPPFCKEVN